MVNELGEIKIEKQRKNEKLEPCPFCGSEDTEIRKQYDSERLSYVFCSYCEARGSVCIDEKTAIAVWNYRVHKIK